MPCIIVSQLLIPITIIDYYHNYGCLMFMYQTKITASVWAKVKQILQTDSFLHSFHLSDIHSTNAFQSLIYWRNSWRCWGNIVLGGVLLSHRALLAVRKRDSKGSESGQGQLSGGDRRAGSSGWEGARSGKSCRQWVWARTALRRRWEGWFQWLRRSQIWEELQAEGAACTATWRGKKGPGS